MLPSADPCPLHAHAWHVQRARTWNDEHPSGGKVAAAGARDSRSPLHGRCHRRRRRHRTRVRRRRRHGYARCGRGMLVVLLQLWVAQQQAVQGHPRGLCDARERLARLHDVQARQHVAHGQRDAVVGLHAAGAAAVGVEVQDGLPWLWLRCCAAAGERVGGVGGGGGG